MLGAAIASLIAVGAVLFRADTANGDVKYLEAGLAVASVFVSWTLVHTVFTLKYARLYYSGDAGGIDFNEADPPEYTDFAYLAFTIGMTFQVSDTDIKSKQIRRTALRPGADPRIQFPGRAAGRMGLAGKRWRAQAAGAGAVRRKALPGPGPVARPAQ